MRMVWLGRPAAPARWFLSTLAAICLTPFDARSEPKVQPAQANPPPQAQITPDCSCRAYGVLHSIGAEICLRTPQGLARFRCGMDLNVTSWKKLDTPCPES